MKIIFNNEEEKKKYFEMMSESAVCPSDMGLDDPNNCDGWGCDTCWQLAISHDIKEPEA